jgi:hypothetical protein
LAVFVVVRARFVIESVPLAQAASAGAHSSAATASAAAPRRSGRPGAGTAARGVGWAGETAGRREMAALRAPGRRLTAR